MARKAKGPGYTPPSGKSPAFKMMGSSPVKMSFSQRIYEAKNEEFDTDTKEVDVNAEFEKRKADEGNVEDKKEDKKEEE